MNRNFFGKSGSVTFFLLSIVNFVQSFVKIVRAVSQKNGSLVIIKIFILHFNKFASKTHTEQRSQTAAVVVSERSHCSGRVEKEEAGREVVPSIRPTGATTIFAC